MKTQFYTAASLDGFIATEDDSLDWLFPLGDINDTSYPAFIPAGHPKLPHLWPVKLPQAGRSDYAYSAAVAMREAASFRR